MRVLVTGDRGFVGRHMVRALESRGFEVFGCDIRRGGAEDARRVFAREIGRASGTYDVVVHAAAHVGGRRDIEGRPTYLGAYNLQLDGALFEWALKTKPAHLVYLSSSAVYPVVFQEPWGGQLPPGALCEDQQALDNPMQPDATYGWVKLTGERLAQEARAEGLNVHVVRPFSGYGEDQSEDYPFPSFVARARRRDDPFEIWGDGRQVRDWIHIDDLTAAILAMVEQDIPGPVNLCTGQGVDFNELAGLFADAAGYRPALKHLEAAPRGVSYRVGDPTRMREFYTPKITLEEGIRRALAG